MSASLPELILKLGILPATPSECFILSETLQRQTLLHTGVRYLPRNRT